MHCSCKKPFSFTNCFIGFQVAHKLPGVSSGAARQGMGDTVSCLCHVTRLNPKRSNGLPPLGILVHIFETGLFLRKKFRCLFESL